MGKRAEAPTNEQIWGLKSTIHIQLILIFTIATFEKSVLILHPTQKFEVKRNHFSFMKASTSLVGRTLPYIIH